MIAAAVALSLFGQPPLPPAVATYRAGAWRVVKHSDRFTGAIDCKVTRPRVAVKGAALIFDVGHDEAPVVVRLDGGAPMAIDAQSPLATVRISPDVALFNPAGGKVALPIDHLAGVRRVWIRLGAQERPLTFEIGGLDAALATASNAGCAAVASTAPRA